MIEYAGVALCGNTAEADQLIAKHCGSWENFWDQHAGRAAQAFAWLRANEVPFPKIGHLYWPNGSSRWALGCFLATETMINEINEESDDETDPESSAIPAEEDQPPVAQRGRRLLIGFRDEQSSGEPPPEQIDKHLVTLEKMWLLPPIPLFYHKAESEEDETLYLCLFVDKRYFWNRIDVGPVLRDLAGEDYQTPVDWNELVNRIQEYTEDDVVDDMLPGEIDFPEETSADYREPHLASTFANSTTPTTSLANVLDYIALHTGTEVLANYDGTTELFPILSEERWQANKDKEFARRSGYEVGLIFNDSNMTHLPKKLAVRFPRVSLGSGESFGTFYEVKAALPDAVGTGVQPFYAAVAADSDSRTDNDPSNQEELEDLATLLAHDYQLRHEKLFSIRLNSICQWDPCPQVDRVQFIYTGEECCTNIYSRPWGYAQDVEHRPATGVASDGVWGRITAKEELVGGEVTDLFNPGYYKYGLYSWVEVELCNDGSRRDKPDGLCGLAYEVNRSNADIQRIPNIVWLRRASTCSSSSSSSPSSVSSGSSSSSDCTSVWWFDKALGNFSNPETV